MPTYMVFRTVGKISGEDVRANLAKSEELGDRFSEVRWIRSYYSVEEGKLYCEYEAPSMELLFEHSRRLGMPIDHAEIVHNLEPSMFR